MTFEPCPAMARAPASPDDAGADDLPVFVWTDHVTNRRKIGANYHFDCKYCEKKITGGSSRLIQHLSSVGKRRGDVRACSLVPTDVADAASRRYWLEDKKKRERREFDSQMRQELHAQFAAASRDSLRDSLRESERESQDFRSQEASESSNKRKRQASLHEFDKTAKFHRAQAAIARMVSRLGVHAQPSSLSCLCFTSALC